MHKGPLMHSATWLEVNGAHVYVEVAGTGQPIFCIHTAGQSGLQYREVLQRLPDHGYQVALCISGPLCIEEEPSHVVSNHHQSSSHS
jgi:hypothetical protein